MEQDAGELGHSFDYAAFMGVAGSAYVGIAGLYTIILFILMYFFWKVRDDTPVKLRGVGFTFGMIMTIHLYLVALFVVYPLNGAFHCWIEYLIMNTLLPLGFAFFTCYHLRFIFRAVREAAIGGYAGKGSNLYKWPALNQHAHNAAKPWYIIVGATWLFFAAFGAAFFGMSHRFHAAYGVYGTWEGELECRRGYEWLPSIGQQFFWAWIVGPMLLYRVSKIRDTRYWGLQTKLSLYAAMLGTPMWLCFLYIQTDATAALNYYFPPAMWFAPGIIVIQLSALLLPMWDSYRNTPRYHRNALSSEGLCGTQSCTSSRSYWVGRTRAALDLQLRCDPKSLLIYAATKDFTAENVQFVVQARQFKRAFTEAERNAIERGNLIDRQQRVKLYLQAGKIFFGLINPETAVYPININHSTLLAFKSVFSRLRCLEDRSSSPGSSIAPWDSQSGPQEPVPACPTPKRSIFDRIFKRKTPSATQYELESGQNLVTGSTRTSSSSQKIWIEDVAIEFKDEPFEKVPSWFNGCVFDEAEKHITDLIWKNTFQGFVEHTPMAMMAIYSRCASDEFLGLRPDPQPRSRDPPATPRTPMGSELRSLRSNDSFDTNTSAVEPLQHL